MGRGGWKQGYMLLSMESIGQNTCLYEKRPELLQETSGTMFFKARSQIFFGISKIFLFHHKCKPQNDHSKLFFCQNSL